MVAVMTGEKGDVLSIDRNEKEPEGSASKLPLWWGWVNF